MIAHSEMKNIRDTQSKNNSCFISLLDIYMIKYKYRKHFERLKYLLHDKFEKFVKHLTCHLKK